MKIVIASLAKSGTSALFFMIKNSLPHDAKGLFEPNGYISSMEDGNRTILAKILLYDATGKVDYASFDCFDKKILIVRDPRDRLISMLLYQVCNSFCGDEKKIAKFISLLKQKEYRPRSVAVLDILKLIRGFGWHDFWKRLLVSPKPSKIKKSLKNVNFYMEYMYGRYFDLATNFYAWHKDYFIIKYEDFITGRIDDLQNYLGFRLHASADVDKRLGIVFRRGLSGDWKNWFLEKDIRFFKPIFSCFMEKYNYPNDWKVNPNPRIYPQYCSGYVRRVLEYKRKNDKYPQAKVF